MSDAGLIRIAAEELRALVARLFTATGLQEDAAARVAAGLVEADLEGMSSHGVMLIDMYLDRIRHGSVATKAAGTVVSDRQSAVVLDAGHALGQITGEQAMALAVERAKAFGVGVAAVRHGFHFGTARRYAQRAAEAGCIGIAMCNTRPLMPAPGGAERVVGNNPIAIALPAAAQIPVVLDMATSEAAMGKIRMAEKVRQAIPPTWASGVRHRSDVRASLGRGSWRGGHAALWGPFPTLRLLASVHRDRCRAFLRPGRVSRAGCRSGRARALREAGARCCRAVCSGRAGMAQAPELE